MERSDLFKLGGAVGVVVLAGGVWVLRRPSGPTANFYDLSEQKLFAAPRDAFAPITGIGGESNDGVEAVVIHCPECNDMPEIAYLRTHTPEYKAKEEASRNSGRGIEELTRDWIEEHTLVRRVNGEAWHSTASPEGRAIVQGWKTRCTNGHWKKLRRAD